MKIAPVATFIVGGEGDPQLRGRVVLGLLPVESGQNKGQRTSERPSDECGSGCVTADRAQGPWCGEGGCQLIGRAGLPSWCAYDTICTIGITPSPNTPADPGRDGRVRGDTKRRCKLAGGVDR